MGDITKYCASLMEKVLEAGSNRSQSNNDFRLWQIFISLTVPRFPPLRTPLSDLWSFFCHTPPARMLRNAKFMISSRSCFMIRQIMFHVRKLISKEDYPDLRKIPGIELRINFGSVSSLRHQRINNLYS